MLPENDADLSALGKARERLYGREEETSPIESGLSSSTAPAVPHAWQEYLAPRSFGAKHHVHFASRFFLIAVGFFILALGLSAALFYTGGNTVSVDNVELTIQGPTTIAGGDVVPLSIVITNKNPATLQDATLEIDFPEGTRSAEDVTKAFPRFSESVGSLAPGQTVERSVSAILFGGEGAAPVIQVAVSFGAERSNATFVKRTTYPIAISTAPLSVSVDTVSETVSDKPFTIRATVRSNATQAIDGVVLKAQYPAGYLLSESSLPPVGTSFAIGKLMPGASKTITLTGTLTGQDKEERTFHFTVGTAKSANDPTLAVSYMTQQATLTLTAPFLSTSFTINGSSATNPAVAPGTPVAVRVSWANALAVPLANASVEIALSGAALDPASVSVPKGFYRSADRTIIFSRDTDPTLASLSPGATGFALFSFSTLAAAPRNSAITLTVSVAGERVGQTGVPERITASAGKTIRLVSAVTFSTASLHTSGPFVNPGPQPPVPEQATAYAVRWIITNAGNDLADALVTAILPSYVNYTGVTSPADGSITFDQGSRMVTWRIGEMAGGASRTGVFQVSLTPSTSQSGQAPSLTSAPAFSAYDRYAQVQVTTTGAAVSTETPADSGYTANKGVVQ